MTSLEALSPSQSQATIFTEVMNCTENCPGPSCIQGEAIFQCHQIEDERVKFINNWMVVHNPFSPVNFSSHKMSESPHFSKLSVISSRDDRDGLYLAGKKIDCVDTINEFKQTFLSECKYKIDNYIDNEPSKDVVPSYDSQAHFAWAAAALVGVALLGCIAWKYYKLTLRKN